MVKTLRNLNSNEGVVPSIASPTRAHELSRNAFDFGHKLILCAGITGSSVGCALIFPEGSPCERANYPDEWNCEGDPGPDSGSDSGWRPSDPSDNDGDGYWSWTRGQEEPAESLGYDCDDEDPAINAGAVEVCADGIDNNCDWATDDPLAIDAADWWPDADLDGYGNSQMAPVHLCVAPTHPSIPLAYVNNGDDCDDHNSTLQTVCPQEPNND